MRSCRSRASSRRAQINQQASGRRACSLPWHAAVLQNTLAFCLFGIASPSLTAIGSRSAMQRISPSGFQLGPALHIAPGSATRWSGAIPARNAPIRLTAQSPGWPTWFPAGHVRDELHQGCVRTRGTRTFMRDPTRFETVRTGVYCLSRYCSPGTVRVWYCGATALDGLWVGFLGAVGSCRGCARKPDHHCRPSSTGSVTARRDVRSSWGDRWIEGALLTAGLS